MKFKYSALQKTCGWPAIHTRMAEKYGTDEADALIRRAEELYVRYSSEYRDCKGIKKLHVQSAAAFGALYLPLKEKVESERAVEMMTEAARPGSDAKHSRIEKLPAGLFMKVAGAITSTMFGEKAGFRRKQHSNTAAEKSFDLLSCPYVEVLTAMGCPEVCPAICIQDDYSFSGLKNGVVFERKKTLGRGDDCCDFRFCVPEKK